MPDWWMAIAGLLLVGLVGLTWSPLLWAWPAALLMGGASVVMSLAVAVDGLRHQRLATGVFLRRVVLLAGLVLGQSLYRTRGRIAGGLTPFRRRGAKGFTFPRVIRLEEWSEEWQSMEARLRVVEERLIESGAAVRRGGDYDSWDLEVRTGSFASARLIGTVEEHGHGNQMVRWRVWPRVSVGGCWSRLLSHFRFGAGGRFDARIGSLAGVALRPVAVVVLLARRRSTRRAAFTCCRPMSSP